MKKAIIIIFSVILCVGIALVGTALIMTKGNISMLINEDREFLSIEESQVVVALAVNITADTIKIVASGDDKLHIEYYQRTNHPYTYTYENGKATFENEEKLSFIQGLNFVKSKDIIIYLPESVKQSITIKCASGNVVSEIDFDIENLTVELSSGNYTAKNIVTNIMNIDMSSGNLTLNNCKAESSTLQVTSGNMNILDCEIADTDINIVSGDVKINNSTIGSLNIISSSGDISTENLICQTLKSNNISGNSTFKLSGKAVDYTISLKTTSGKLSLNSPSENLSQTSTGQLNNGSGAATINCLCTSGNIKIEFKNT